MTQEEFDNLWEKVKEDTKDTQRFIILANKDGAHNVINNMPQASIAEYLYECCTQNNLLAEAIIAAAVTYIQETKSVSEVFAKAVLDILSEKPENYEKDK